MTRLSLTPLTVVAAVVLLQACAGLPQGGDARWPAGSDATATRTETFEVNRPVRDVAATFQRQAPECLDIAVGTVMRTFASHRNVLTEYRSTVVADGERAELQLQQQQMSNTPTSSKAPASGAVVVAEAI